MTPEKFVIDFKEMMVDESLVAYKKLYSDAESSGLSNQYVNDIKSVLGSLDDTGRESLFNLIKIVCEDSVTRVFSLLDGSSGFVGQTSELRLVSMDKTEEVLSGELLVHYDDLFGE
jgi:hypothetical protein